MSWFLVLLFWNPAIQNFDVANGWYPIEYATETMCEMKEDFLSMYLGSVAPDTETVLDCVQATDMMDAIKQLKENT